MNKLTGTITQVQHSGVIMLVDIDADGQIFSALLIEGGTQQDWIRQGNLVYIVFKETEVSLAKGLSGIISTRNRMACSVIKVERGQLLSKVDLKFGKYGLSSAITTRSLDALQLAPGNFVEALVKANEVSLMKYQD